MKTKRGISLFAIAVLVAGLFLALASREPSHQGKRLSAWLYDLRSDNSEATELAEKAIHQMGDKCVPTLLEMLRSRDSRLKVKLMEWAEGHDFSEEALTRFKIMPAADRSAIASQAFEILGEKAKAAIPGLIEMLGEDFGESNIPYLAASALSGIGGEATLPLMSLLLKPDAVLRERAAYALGEGGSKSELAVPALLKALNDSDADVRSESAHALGQIRRQPEQVVPALVSRLEDIKFGVRARSAMALAGFGTEARSALPALLLCLKVDDRATQSAATLALVRMHQEGDIVVPALMENLHSKHPSVRAKTASALGMLGSEARAAIPALENLTSDTEGVLRGCIVTSVGAEAKAALARIQTRARTGETISNE
jgi:HEAT repeat protein